MDYGACYNAVGSRCSGRAQPGAIALRDGVRNVYPAIGDLGIYNCRQSSGGGGLSTHGEGRGWDAACNANSQAGLVLGNQVAGELVRLHQQLGVQRIIWNRRITDVPNGMGKWRAYHGTSPHTDHLHIELCWKAARDKPLTKAYVIGLLGGEEDDLTDDQAKKLQEIWNALFEKEGGKIVEHLDIIEKKLDELLGRGG